jgi:fatty acid desaturase
MWDQTPVAGTGVDYAAARKLILAELGPVAIARLHRPVPLLDWLALGGLPALFALLAAALTRLDFGLPWLGCLVLQGFVIQALAYATHDLLVHRRAGGHRLGYVIGVIFDFPILTRRTWYALYHLDHHAYMGTPLDPEAYKQDLDARWKRLFCLTLPGAFLLFARRLKPATAQFPEVAMRAVATPTPALVRRLRGERLALLGAMGFVAVLSCWWWRPVVYGYLLPFFVVTPIASMLRLILEHAEITPGNLFHCATFYQTGWISRPAFFWDAGDCHLVHHLYPAIPFYRMGDALALMNPIFVRYGARERRSMLPLVAGFFLRNEPHRALWSR